MRCHAVSRSDIKASRKDSHRLLLLRLHLLLRLLLLWDFTAWQPQRLLLLLLLVLVLLLWLLQLGLGLLLGLNGCQLLVRGQQRRAARSCGQSLHVDPHHVNPLHGRVKRGVLRKHPRCEDTHVPDALLHQLPQTGLQRSTGLLHAAQSQVRLRHESALDQRSVCEYVTCGQ